MRLRRVSLLVLSLSLSSAACAGAATGTDAAHVAQTATEPRTDDPTASQPVPIQESPTKPAPSPTTTASAAPMDEDPPGREPRVIACRHVLIQYMGSDRADITVLRSREQALALAELVLKRAQGGQDLGKLAIEYSDEPGARPRGGSLGRFQRGQMIPAFEEVAFKLKVGQLSGIVETPYGFHVIQRTE